MTSLALGDGGESDVDAPRKGKSGGSKGKGSAADDVMTSAGRKITDPQPPNPAKPVYGTHAHPLEGVFFPPQSAHQVDQDVAPDENLNRSVRILRTTNKAQLNRYVPIAYTFKNVNPFAVLRFMRRPIQMEEGAIFTFISPDGNSGKVLIAIPEYQVASMRELLKTIDRPGLTTADGATRIYRQLKHRRANIDFVNPVLDDSAFINTFAIYLTDNESKIIVDPTRDAVFIEDAPSGAEYLDKAITEKLDYPTPEVILNTKIYELDVANNARIGLDYIAWRNGPGANLFAFGGFAEHGRVKVVKGSGSSIPPINGVENLPLPKSNFTSRGYNFAYQYEVPSAFFDFLSVRNKARVLSSAKVAALNTRTATITTGDQILYYPVQTTDPSGVRPKGDPLAVNKGRTVIGTTTAISTEIVATPVLGTGGVIFEEVTGLFPVQTGLSLDLTPTIYENGVDIALAGDVSSYNGFDDTGFPRINRRTFTSTLRMGEGEEVILGGLTRESQVKAGNKAPWLGSIPILGYMFGGENTRRSQFEVVVALAAEKIERFDGKGSGISDAEKSIMQQGEGSVPIETPKTIPGFDQFLLDKEKAPYSLKSTPTTLAPMGGSAAPAAAPAAPPAPPPPPPPAN
jgi:type II secretory pathway component GspD/PulD (secretin)